MKCDKLHPFFDKELDTAEAAEFRQHLARCASCQSELEDLIQLQLLESSAQRTPSEAKPELPGAVHHRPPVSGPRVLRRGIMVMAGGALAAAMVLLTLRILGPATLPPGTMLAQAPTRPLEPRLTFPGADSYRPYQSRIMRGDPGAAQESLPLRELAALEEARDYRGLAAVYLLHGDEAQARLALERAGEGPDVESDRAALLLASALKNPNDVQWRVLGEALDRVERVLAQRADHPQALFNRALILRELGLTMLSANAFDQAASRAQDGWGGEARQHAENLRNKLLQRQSTWKLSDELGKALVSSNGPVPLAAAQENPGLIRLYFYEAVRTAQSAERLRNLQPLAAELDRRSGGEPVLQEYVRDVGSRSFATRGPLAVDYGQLVQGTLPGTSRETFLARLRASEEKDILLGALVRIPAAVREGELDALARDARLRRDPWMRLVLEQEIAQQEMRKSRWDRAEQRLLSALKECSSTRLVFRCARLERKLVDLYVALHRTTEAHKYASKGLKTAQAAQEWKLEREFLQELAQIAKLRDQRALAHGYLEESLLRDPGDCEQQRYVNKELAAVDMADLKVQEARQEIVAALRAAEQGGERCARPFDLSGALVLADLARFGGIPGDARSLKDALVAVRAPPADPGEQALASAIEGRFELVHDRAKGQAILWRTVAQADSLRMDVSARKARALAYTALVLDEGKAGAFEQALEILGKAMETEVPARCLLGVVVEDERTLFLSRNSSGETAGFYDATRSHPLERDISRLVPDEVIRSLASDKCERVDVLALPPVYGRAGLLPSRIAWSYRMGPSRRPAASATVEKHLVVANMEAPAELGLERLGTWSGPAQPDRTLVALTGKAATPSRVLAEMRAATEIEFHAHGVLDPNLSDASLLVLSADDEGQYALTAGEVRRSALAGAPLVLLASCYAAYSAPQLHEPYSLPSAFIQAGARAVLAAISKVPDDEAPRFFEAVRTRIRAGESPAVATRNERMAWLAREKGHWVEDVLVFE